MRGQGSVRGRGNRAFSTSVWPDDNPALVRRDVSEHLTLIGVSRHLDAAALEVLHPLLLLIDDVRVVMSLPQRRRGFSIRTLVNHRIGHDNGRFLNFVPIVLLISRRPWRFN